MQFPGRRPSDLAACPSDVPESAPWSQALKLWALFLLFLTAIFSLIDRQIIGILMDSIKKDLRVNDTAMGMLTGIYFSLFYLVAGIPLARLADLGNRRNLIALSLAVWSAATMACGMAQNYLQLALARVFVAFGEAGSSPATSSMVAAIFPASHRTRVMAILLVGASIGTAGGIFVGGTLHAIMSWRMVFVTAGLPGLIFAGLLWLTLPEPQRHAARATAGRGSTAAALAALARIPTYRMLCFISVGAAMTGYAMLAWMPSFLIRVHHLASGVIAVQLSAATAAGLIGGALTAGQVADRLACIHPGRLIWASCFGLACTIPAGLAVAFAPTGGQAIVAFGVFMYFFGFWPAPVNAAILGVVDEGSRALGSAGTPFFQTVGGAFGPVLIGLINDGLRPQFGEGSIQYGIALGPVGCALGVVGCLIAGRTLARDYRAD